MKKIDISTTNYKKKVDEKKNIQPQKPNKIEIKNKSINIKTESYGKIDENLYRANRDINDFQKLINIKEVNKMYEMKKKKNKTPKMKTKKIKKLIAQQRILIMTSQQVKILHLIQSQIYPDVLKYIHHLCLSHHTQDNQLYVIE